MRQLSSIRGPVVTVALVSLVVLGAVLLFRVLHPSLREVEQYRDLAERWGSEFGIQPEFILAVVAVESAGDPTARSRVGARGLMQLMPATAREVAGRLGVAEFEPEQLDSPELNIRFGAFYLGRLADRFGSNRPATVLAAYNAGPGTVRRWLAGLEAPSDAELAARIEYPETRAYVRKVLAAWSALRQGRRPD